MEVCVTPSPKVSGDYKPFPERLYAIPPRIASGSVPGVSVETYQEDNKKWKKHVNAYKKINRLLDTGRYRNIMDMNAGLGSFAAVIRSSNLWVMNVVPTICVNNILLLSSSFSDANYLTNGHLDSAIGSLMGECNSKGRVSKGGISS